jgi:hypothetical protein
MVMLTATTAAGINLPRLVTVETTPAERRQDATRMVQHQTQRPLIHPVDMHYSSNSLPQVFRRPAGQRTLHEKSSQLHVSHPPVSSSYAECVSCATSSDPPLQRVVSTLRVLSRLDYCKSATISAGIHVGAVAACQKRHCEAHGGSRFTEPHHISTSRSTLAYDCLPDTVYKLCVLVISAFYKCDPAYFADFIPVSERPCQARLRSAEL